MSANRLPSRAELPRELTWDLEAIYATSEEWESDFFCLNEAISKVNSFRGRLGESAAVLRDAYIASDSLSRLAEKLYVYSHLRADEDTANSVNASREQRISAAFAELSAALAWFEPELTALSEEQFSLYLQAPELKFYRRTLWELERARKHILSAAEERIIGMYSDVTGAPGRIYSVLKNADTVYPKIADASGKKIELSNGNYLKFLESADRKVRKNAFRAMLETQSQVRNTCAATLDATVKRHVVGAKLRGYNSALEAALFGDNVPREVYTNLISSVRANLDGLHSYVKVRSKALDRKKIDMFDLFAPIVKTAKKEYSWEQAKDLMFKGLEPLGDDYAELLGKAFSERWVDVLECRGKRSGAYSSGCYDTYPYLLLNFQNTLNDVFTLAHEFGHSMHSYYSNQAQEPHYSSYSIFVAEVASTTNEILLQNYLMANAKDPELKAYLLSHLIDEIRGTVFRQTQFAEFELRIHELAEAGVPLTADLLDEEYGKLNADYYGKHMKQTPLIEREWLRIPHFYYNFYVYKYATGMSAAIQLADGILSGDPAKLSAYFGFLKAGSSKDVLDIMRDAGVDLATPAPVEACMRVFKGAVDSLQKLI